KRRKETARPERKFSPPRTRRRPARWKQTRPPPQDRPASFASAGKHAHIAEYPAGWSAKRKTVALSSTICRSTSSTTHRRKAKGALAYKGSPNRASCASGPGATPADRNLRLHRQTGARQRSQKREAGGRIAGPVATWPCES